MQTSICNANATVNTFANASKFNALHNKTMQMTETETDHEQLVQWINALVKAEKSTPSQVALKRGFSPSTLTRFLNGETKSLSKDVLRKLATDSAVIVPLFLQRRLDLPLKNQREQDVNIWSTTTDDRIPVWGIHPTQRDGEFKLNPMAVSFLERVNVANRSLKLAAFYAPDETMSPRWSAGEPVLYDRAKPAGAGDFAMVRLAPATDPNAEETYLFRQVVRRSNGMLHLVALTAPETPISIPLERVLEVRHVLTWSDLLG